MPRRPSREEREWTLFADWCASMNLTSMPAAADTIASFLSAFPASMSTQGRRVRAIRRAHLRTGVPLELSEERAHSVLRTGEGWATVAEALADVPKYHHPMNYVTALRGRRDGWLIVLAGLVGLNRDGARTLTHHDVALFPSMAVHGAPIPRSDPASECAACAVTRWLRVLGPAAHSWWSDVKEAVQPIQNPAQHDCAIGLDGLWRKAPTLLPAIDQHGWLSAEPMSTRAISATMALRQGDHTADPETQKLRTVSTGRFATATPNELADAYDDVDEQLAALLLRSSQILSESDEMLERISSFGL